MGPKCYQKSQFFDPSDHHTTIISVVAKFPPSKGNITLKFGHRTRLTFLHAEAQKVGPKYSHFLYWVSQKKLLHKSEAKSALKKEDDVAES